MSAVPPKRVLAVDLFSRGFGFAVLDGPNTLSHVGLRGLRGEDRHAICIAKVKQLIDWTEPDVLILLDMREPSSHRPESSVRLSDELAHYARATPMNVRLVRWSEVRRTCASSPTASKYEIAQRLAEQFPQLREWLPPKRVPWANEPEGINVFDAVALGVTAHDRSVLRAA